MSSPSGSRKTDSVSGSNGCDLSPNGSKSRKVAVVTGITGQDGTYLAELLLSKGYEVHGLTGIRRAGTFNKHRIEQLYENPSLESTADHYAPLVQSSLLFFDFRNVEGKFQLHYGDMTDSSGLTNIIKTIQPTEIYNLAAQSNVKESFELGEYTMNVDGLGTLRLLNAICANRLCDQVRFYQASTSELYGKVQEIPQTETTPFYPQSPYGCAKLFAHWIVKNYREAYGLYACNGILFNHESPRRGEAFVTRKITQSVARISVGQQEFVELGNLDAVRDWGHAKDYVQAMWLMLQQDVADDYVISTGVAHSVRQFVEAAFRHIGVTIQWEGSGVDEVGKDKSTGVVRVKVNPKYYRPIEIDTPLGDSSKARKLLNWEPLYNFETLVTEMVEHDLNLLRAGTE